jgi:hypothetical protein
MKIKATIKKLGATAGAKGITETVTIEGGGIVNQLRPFLEEQVLIEITKVQLEIGDKKP